MRTHSIRIIRLVANYMRMAMAPAFMFRSYGTKVDSIAYSHFNEIYVSNPTYISLHNVDGWREFEQVDVTFTLQLELVDLKGGCCYTMSAEPRPFHHPREIDVWQEVFFEMVESPIAI